MNYHNITHDDMNNGEGLRVVLWLSGCSHHCHNCQNPQTWNPDSGIKFDEVAKKEIFDELSKDYTAGITLSGGDPLHKNNIDEVLSLVNEIHVLFPQKTIWLYSGYTWEEIWEYRYGNKYNKENVNIDFLRQVTVLGCNVFVDGKYEEDKRDITLKWMGSNNQRVIDVQKSIEENNIKLYCN